MRVQDFDPEEHVIEWGYELCSFHKENPLDHYSGCTCTGWYTMRIKNEEEKKKERDERSVRDR